MASFQANLIFAGKARDLPPLKHTLAYLANIGLPCKNLPGANTQFSSTPMATKKLYKIDT
jgi:hypothetical protein